MIRTAVAAALLATPSVALANGAFPASGQVLRSPVDPQQIVVSTTYGLARSDDGGGTFDLVCEQALGLPGGLHPFFAVTPQGKLVGGLPDGLVVLSMTGCEVRHPPELGGAAVVDVSVDTDGRVLALAALPGQITRIYGSADDALTFAPVGVDLPVKLDPLTIDAAPSDPAVLYATALTGDPPIGVLVRSDDEGASYQVFGVPGSEASTAPFLAGIDPADPLRIFVRTNGAPGRLLLSEDGGASFSELATTTGFLRAFDLAPDGSHALFGGDLDGLFRLDLATLQVAPLSRVAARCVNHVGDAVLACTTPSVEGFSAGISRDGGQTFARLYEQRCLRGPLACRPGSPVTETCAAAWPMVRDLLGVVDCEGAGGSAPTSSAQAGATSGSGASDGAGGGAGQDSVGGGGCACQAVGQPSPPPLLLTVALVGLGLRRRRLRKAALPARAACSGWRDACAAEIRWLAGVVAAT